MTYDKLAQPLRRAFALLRTRPRYAPILLRCAIATHEDADPDWQPL